MQIALRFVLMAAAEVETRVDPTAELEDLLNKQCYRGASNHEKSSNGNLFFSTSIVVNL